MNSNKDWIVRATADEMSSNETVRHIAHELKITLPTAQLLVNRGCCTVEEAYNFLAYLIHSLGNCNPDFVEQA